MKDWQGRFPELSNIRVLRLSGAQLLASTNPADAADKALLKQVHAATKRASQAMEEDFGFNVAIAECRSLFNAIDLQAQSPAVVRRGIETLVQLLSPMVPHICAELWRVLGHDDRLEAAGWPAFDEAELVDDEVEYPVQINGKVRGKVSLPNGLAKPELEALVAEHAGIAALIEGKVLRKAIVVPGRIVNLVVG